MGGGISAIDTAEIHQIIGERSTPEKKYIVAQEVNDFLNERTQKVAKAIATSNWRENLRKNKSETRFIPPPQSRSQSSRSIGTSGSIRELALLNHHTRKASIDFSSSKNLTLFEPPRKLPGLKVVIVDDNDWIPVNDEGGGEDENGSPRARSRLSKPSYLFTRSGTMLLEGFSPAIGERGLKMFSDSDGAMEYGNKIPMDERLVILSKLGTGSTSIVYKAFDIQEMKIVAVKKINVFEKGKRRQIIRELDTLLSVFGKKQQTRSSFHLRRSQFNKQQSGSKFATIYEANSVDESGIDGVYKEREKTKTKNGCDHILEFYDAFSDPEGGGIALMMEFMDGGSLQDIADSGGCQDEELLASIAYQALRGLEYLHQNGHLHRDLKPANILINHQGYVKISDFGIVKSIDSKDKGSSSNDASQDSAASGPSVCRRNGFSSDLNVTRSTEVDSILSSSRESGAGAPLKKALSFVGTAAYMSPERIDGKEYSFPSDVWAFGLVMVTLAEGKLPVDTTGFWSMLHAIRDMPPPELSGMCDWSEEFRDFIQSCLRKDPAERLTCTDLLEHPFLDFRIREDKHPLGDFRDELSEIFERLKEHLVTLKIVNEKLVSKSTSVHYVLNVLFFSSPGGGRYDDTTVNHRLSELSKQLSIPESTCLIYAKEFLSKVADEAI